MQVPAQQRGLHATLIITGDVQWRTCHSFFNFNLSVWQGLSREPQDMNFLCHLTKQLLDQWLSHAAQGLSGVSFPDVINWQERQTMDQSGLHTTYGLSSVFRPRFRHGAVVSWSGDLPASDSLLWFDGFSIMKLFLIHLSLFSTNKALSTLRWFLSCDKLDSSLDWAYKDSPTDFCTNFLWLKPCDSDQYLIASDLDFDPWLPQENGLWLGISIPWLPLR